MLRPKRLDLDQLFEGSLHRLRAEAEYFSRLTDHDPELGRLNEAHLLRLLRAYLPPKVGIGTGFVACGGASSMQSPQCDIVLFDALNNSPLYTSEVWSIYPIEMVYGVIEVKTSLDRRGLEDAFVKCAKLRAMASGGDHGNKAYVVQVPSEPGSVAKYQVYTDSLPPRFFVFAYDGWKSMETLEKNFVELSYEHEGAHIHGVCSLCTPTGVFIGHKAYKMGDDRLSKVSSNGFRVFLMNLPVTLNSMLPPHRLGLGFDQFHLGHYAFSIE